MSKKITMHSTIHRITLVRARNNLLWMGLLELAITAKPRKAKAIIKQIKTNDEEISRLTGDLAK